MFFVYNIHFLKLFKINFELNGTLKIAAITIVALKDIRASSKAAIVNKTGNGSIITPDWRFI